MIIVTYEQFETQLALLLSGKPPGVAADLAGWAIAYWNGCRVVYQYLSSCHPRALDEEFELTENEWEQWREELLAWAASPRFSDHAELHDLIIREWPRDAGR